MKVLQVIDELKIGGAEKVYVTICNTLHKNNVEVSCLFLREGGVLSKELKEMNTFFQLHRYNKWSFKKMYECSRIIKNYQIIHCHLRHVYFYIKLISIIFNVKGKIIFHNHSSKKLNKFEQFLLKHLFKPKYLICVDNFMFDEYSKILKNKEHEIFLLKNIILVHPNKNSVKKDKSIFELVLVGNFKKNKNNIFAIEIAEKLKKSLLLIGKNQDLVYYNQLKERKDTSLEKIIMMEDVDDVNDYLKMAHFGLMVSLKETGPLVLLEYLNNELPFLAFDTGEISKMLKPHYPEFFIDNFDVNSWVERINLIFAKEYDKSKMHKIINQYFGEEEFFKNLMFIYKCVQKN
ncbi:glycosyltransferase family 4 protein [Flavobacterium filum]|uniref:glycosyltransferase family 4 protein n=1 Tax=Flavobacterium TaxID=237 RepID=UPI00040A3249|nr:glycosyltransferase family 4 protein [Flavobacterium filum]